MVPAGERWSSRSCWCLGLGTKMASSSRRLERCDVSNRFETRDTAREEPRHTQFVNARQPFSASPCFTLSLSLSFIDALRSLSSVRASLLETQNSQDTIVASLSDTHSHTDSTRWQQPVCMRTSVFGAGGHGHVQTPSSALDSSASPSSASPIPFPSSLQDEFHLDNRLPSRSAMVRAGHSHSISLPLPASILRTRPGRAADGATDRPPRANA
jgi:hypothetical protein